MAELRANGLPFEEGEARRAPAPRVPRPPEEGAADEERLPYGKQPCLQCGYPISEIAGSKGAICPRCGFKDPCC